MTESWQNVGGKQKHFNVGIREAGQEQLHKNIQVTRIYCTCACGKTIPVFFYAIQLYMSWVTESRVNPHMEALTFLEDHAIDLNFTAAMWINSH